jgi:hypothetical protein
LDQMELKFSGQLTVKTLENADVSWKVSFSLLFINCFKVCGATFKKLEHSTSLIDSNHY